MFYSPEAHLINKRTSKEDDLRPNEQALYDYFLQNNKLRKDRVRRMQMRDMDEFGDVYGTAAVAEDQALVTSVKERDVNMDKTQRAELLEFIMTTLENANWFGEDGYAIFTTEYDDRMNHTDFVLEWESENGERTTKIAVDCTVAEGKENLEKKAERIAEDIYNGYATTIKYFQSEVDDYRGRSGYMPRVVVGIKKEHLEDISAIVLSVLNKEAGSNAKLEKHYLQLTILKNIQAQLEIQLDYVRQNKLNIKKHGSNINIMTWNVRQALKKITSIIEEKENSLEDIAIRRAAGEASASGFSPVLRASLRM